MTGDIAYSGRTEEYERASDFFNNILEILNLEREAIFFVPGNHAVQSEFSDNLFTQIL